MPEEEICGCCGVPIGFEFERCTKGEKRCQRCQDDYTPQTFFSQPPCQRGFGCLRQKKVD